MDKPEKVGLKNWAKYTEYKISGVFERLKAQRIKLFIEKLNLGSNDKILDLGSEDGAYLAKYYPYPHNITIADIYEPPMVEGVKKHGLGGYRVIPIAGRLPIEDGEFSAVWCNSVIEHVTIPREELGEVSNSEFKERAEAHQREFASEIRRIARSYFVQTPNVHFPIESHSILPLIPYMPHTVRFKLGNVLKKVWIKQWTADFYLYDKARFMRHYEDASEIVEEKAFGLVKSYIAIRKKV